MSYSTVDKRCTATTEKREGWLDVAFPMYWLKEYVRDIEECDNETLFTVGIALDGDHCA